MDSNSKSSMAGDLLSKNSIGKDGVPSAAPMKPSAPPTKPSAASMKPIGQSAVSLAGNVSGDSSSTKRNGKAVVCSDVPSKTLIGLEMLLVDAEGTVMKGFIPPGRIDTYLRHMVPGSTYRLNSFFGSKAGDFYRVADPDVVISFSWKFVLSVIKDSSIRFREDRFHFHGYEQFEAACGLKGDLYDYIGHIKLVNEQALTESLVIDENEVASTRRVLVHVQTHDGPVMKLYLWDKAATVFCEKFKTLGRAPSVIMVTTVNPKRFGGAFSLSSMTSSRVFFDMDAQPTRDYLAWLETNSEVANRVQAEIVTKAETATIGELLSYMKKAGAKVAWFECTATIDDVVRDAAWYYIACGGCKTKATKGPTTLMCKKCGKAEITGAAEYLTKISVYDNNDHASFVVLGDAGRELTGKKACDLVQSYYEANKDVGDDHVVPVPQVMIDAIGQKRTFVIKVSNHNLEGKTQALTVTKVLPLAVPALGRGLGENVVVTPTAETLEGVNRVEGSSIAKENPAEDEQKRGLDVIATEEAKRAKLG